MGLLSLFVVVVLSHLYISDKKMDKIQGGLYNG